ncbi:hypothetical protein QCN29_05075 [Streptomyces sp. HNM0663]|uniref:Uncharacterized protein n=1 Tax=Streptomyces chengmaiensis TaxID=3040919 RepID=A0ABT6HIK1_9ACTN|nr:hypothetical protein [Streptomyces chengmaiensis]MDH2388171.1 hypothetical protein [Streptomyces chengmaiensis]
MALGTVAGVATQSDGTFVALQVPGAGLRLIAPYDLELVARCARPMTAGRAVTALIAFGVAIAAGGISSQSVLEPGAHWSLVLFASLGAYTAVKSAFLLWLRLTGPRRFRI